MIGGLRVSRLRSPDSNISVHELSLIIIINGSIGILSFIEFYESKSSEFSCNMILRDVDRDNLSEGIKERIDIVLCYSLR